jgi:hypothetical protein
VTRYIWGEREGGRRVGDAIGGTAAAAECPLRAACKGRGQGRGQRCGQSYSLAGHLLLLMPASSSHHRPDPLPSPLIFLGQRILPLLIGEEESRCASALSVGGFDFDGVEVRPESDLNTSAALNQGRRRHRDHGWWWWNSLVIVEEGWTPSSCRPGWTMAETWRCWCWWSPTRCSRFHQRCW